MPGIKQSTLLPNMAYRPERPLSLAHFIADAPAPGIPDVSVCLWKKKHAAIGVKFVVQIRTGITRAVDNQLVFYWPLADRIQIGIGQGLVRPMNDSPGQQRGRDAG